jgi:hypothetical protein
VVFFLYQVHLTGLACLAQLQQTDTVMFNQQGKLHPRNWIFVLLHNALGDLNLFYPVASNPLNELSCANLYDHLLTKVILEAD